MGLPPAGNLRILTRPMIREATMISHRSLLALFLVLLPSMGLAKKPEDVFGGRILLSDKPFPTQSKSVGTYVASLRKQARDQFWENKEKQQWVIYYSAFFKRPLSDLEVTLKTYDISDGAKRMVESYELYLGESGQRAFSGKMTLDKGEDRYATNSRILAVMEHHGSVVAQATFAIGGQGKHYSGKVEFDKDEAEGRDDKGK